MGAIRIKRRSSTGSTGAPAALLNAELAYNEADNTLYYGYGDNGSGSATSVVSIAGQGAYATLNTAQTITGNKVFSGNLTYTGSVDSNANNTQVATTGWVQNRISSSAYSLPTATTSTLGGIIVGNNLSVDANGVLSGVNSYTLPAATTSTLGGVIIGNGLTVEANGSISVNTNYIKDDAANGTLTITGDAGSTTADLLSETTGSHYQTTVNNSGTYGFTNWYLKSSPSSQQWTWGGFGIDSSQQSSTLTYNYAPNFGSGLSYGRGIKITGSDITVTETSLGGASLPSKTWTANSILTQSYADTRYLQNSTFGSNEYGFGTTACRTGIDIYGTHSGSDTVYLAVQPKGTNSPDDAAASITQQIVGNNTLRNSYTFFDRQSYLVQLLGRDNQPSDTQAYFGLEVQYDGFWNFWADGTANKRLWNNSSVLTQGYADTRYLQSTGTGSIGDLTVTGNLTVQGTTTTLNTDTLVVEDKNIVIANVTSPTDLTADGGGLTLLGATNKTFNWYDATDAWTSSEHFDLANGKQYKINNVAVLTASGLGSSVVSSSLTSVGTISSGTWQGTTVGVSYGGTGSTSITGLVKGNGASPMTAATAGTDYLAPDSTIDGGTF